MPAKKKPGDLSHLGRTDPVERDASWFPTSGYRGSRTPSEAKEIRQNYNESVRREFRQSEDAGMNIRHNVNGKQQKKAP
jgi:hypothetical protein